MRSDLTRYWCVLMLLLSALSQGRELKTDEPVGQVIQMTARKYEFSPSQVHVKVGMKVQLKITATDRDHGFEIGLNPAGDSSSAHPGLMLTSPARTHGWSLNKGKETMIEFVASAPGTYEFKCSLVCGLHHGRMKGQVIVDP